MSPLLAVNNVNAGYGKVTVLRGVNLQIEAGEIVAVIGPNGAGKSSLLKTIVGLLRPSAGTVMYKNNDITHLPAHKVAREGIGYVQEGGHLFDNMTVRENIIMGAFSHRENLKTGLVEEIYHLFPVLKDRWNQYARDLSGGQKQMVAIARGLASRPSLLMLDEPSLGLAPKLVDEIYEKLQILKGMGMTVLLVEQDTAHALELADRGYVLENGVIVMDGSGAELARSAHVQEYYLGV